MHDGTSDPAAWYARHERRRHPINFGASFHHLAARRRLGLSRYASATPSQVDRLAAIAEQALREGALGVSFAPEYAPGMTRDEIVPLMHLARRYQAPVFFHARYSDVEAPGTSREGLEEIIGYARETGVAVHIDHLTSTGGTFEMKEALALLDEARVGGVDLTASAYPYVSWATTLSSARFDPGWQQRFRISFGDLQLAGSAERLTAASFARYRRDGRLAVAHAIPEEDVIDALRSALVMIGSDAILEPGFRNHPRASGTFARTLGHYARGLGVLSLPEAVAKMTIMPARLLEGRAEAFKRKGRLAPGADADLTIFDYERVIDRATIEHPELPSTGIVYVVVGGKVVKDPRGIRRAVQPGQGIRADRSRPELGSEPR
jgi:dihydroorotase